MPRSISLKSSSKPFVAKMGRFGQQLVESPTLTTVETRTSNKKPRSNLFLSSKTIFKSVPGARRQTLSFERKISDKGVPETHFDVNEIRRQHQKHKLTAPIITREQYMILPELLSEDVWERHRYSLLDIRRTLDAFPERIIWKLVISYNKPTTNTCTKIASDLEKHVTYSGRPTAIQKLITVINESNKELADRPLVTWNKDEKIKDRHVPNLPVHRLTPPSFEMLKENLIQRVFLWRDIWIVALELNKEQNLLLMARIIPWADYIQIYGVPTSYRLQPKFLQFKETSDYFAVMNEMFYFFCPVENNMV